MSKKEKTAVLPKYRFSEFAASGPIICEKGNLIFEPISNKNHNSDLPVLAITQEYGAIPRDEIDYTVSVTEKSLEGYKVVEKGDFIISLRSFQGGIEYSVYDGICSPAYIILRKKTDIVEQYYKHYFKSYRFIQDLNKNLEGIRDGKMVSYSQFSAILLPKPDKKEQQKIADCLTSLDDLINAENKKLTTLKAHKKGLMQKLFPVEGETLPEFRFPEFTAKGEWKFTTLNELAVKIVDKNKEGVITRVFTNSAVDGVVDQSEYFDREIVTKSNIGNYYVIDEGDYVYNPRISNYAPVGPISKNKIGKGVMSPLYTIFRFNNKENDFYEQYFKTNLWNSYLKNASNTGARHDRISISVDNFMKMPLPYSSSIEQQKIADCLASIDDLIAAENSKLTAIRAHKKALMQGLFPSIEEVDV